MSCQSTEPRWSFPARSFFHSQMPWMPSLNQSSRSFFLIQYGARPSVLILS